MRIHGFLGLLGLLGLLACLPALLHANPAAGDAAEPEARPGWMIEADAADSFDRNTAGLKAVLVLLTLGLVVHRRSADRSQRSPGQDRRYRAALALLALLAFASFYKFSVFHRSESGVHLWDVYHYYIGSKYFPELGYSRIYECTLAAAAEDEWELLDEIRWTRDLRTMKNWNARVVLSGSSGCRPSFSPERWQEFKQDLLWFDSHLASRQWRAILTDHGYNASPVWTLVGRGLASVFPVESLVAAVHVDMLWIGLTLAAIGWAFGFEALCLATIVWGTGFLWRWIWVGDAFARHAWFASAMIGICCLKRGRPIVAGALLSLSALLRLFPLIFSAGYGLQGLFDAKRTRRWPVAQLRFAAGFGLGAAVLVAASFAATGRGAEAWTTFARNTAIYSDVVASNKAGAPALLWRLDGSLAEALTGEAPERVWVSTDASRALGLAVIVGFGVLYARALRRSEGWEAAAASFTLIPVVSAPGGYYFSFVVAGVMLATRRPRIAVWLLSACLVWLVNGIVFFPLDEIASQFTGVSTVALLLSAAVLLEMARPAETRAAQGVT